MADVKISVAIPAHNATKTIRATLDSVLGQTVTPHEILVMDDGSTDETVSMLRSYEPRVTVLSQPNAGTAGARNALVRRARGDVIAFLDADDIWHPKYLEAQRKSFEENPTAALFFTGHFDFDGGGELRWREIESEDSGTEVIGPAEFVERCCSTAGVFGSMSFCCVRRSALVKLDTEAFQVHGSDDQYLFTLIPLFGWSTVYNPAPLAAYRVTSTSLSANWLHSFGRTVKVFEILAVRYSTSTDATLRKEFGKAFALKRRAYAKVLMGAGMTSDARREIVYSVRATSHPAAAAKSLAMLAFTYMPKSLQPRWLPATRPGAA